MNDFLQIGSILLWLLGTFMLTFGLKVTEGIDPKFRKELKIPEGMIAPSEVRQRPFLIYGGLIAITIASVFDLLSFFKK